MLYTIAGLALAASPIVFVVSIYTSIFFAGRRKNLLRPRPQTARLS